MPALNYYFIRTLSNINKTCKQTHHTVFTNFLKLFINDFFIMKIEKLGHYFSKAIKRHS